MAGRGTDIKLGPGVKELGGLCVIGTERHESRRIDNQLRGRSGRQGDPGETIFYMSLEDDLMKRFGSERIKKVLSAMKVEDEDAVIQSRMISRQVEGAQKRVEGNNYDTRKNTLQYDDVMREQREVIYKQRMQVITAEHSLKDVLLGMIQRTIKSQVDSRTNGDPANWDLDGLYDFAITALVSPKELRRADLNGKSIPQLYRLFENFVQNNYQLKQNQLQNDAQMLEFEKVVILRVVDEHWTNHIDEMDQLRQSIGLRGYGQMNPLVEYQEEGFQKFEQMIADIEYDVTRLFMKAEIRQNAQR